MFRDAAKEIGYKQRSHKCEEGNEIENTQDFIFRIVRDDVPAVKLSDQLFRAPMCETVQDSHSSFVSQFPSKGSFQTAASIWVSTTENSVA